MKLKELANKCGFTFFYRADEAERDVSGAYCCDLLSWVIGRAQEGDALVTVMSNQNVIAVALMSDLPCVVLTEGVQPDANMLEKAESNGITVLSSSMPTYETAVKIFQVLHS